MKQFALLLLFAVCTLSVQAQNEAANWYFGTSAGLSFTMGNPVALTDGILSTQEGCATISDFNGNLLFYTDGILVFNRNHAIMPNGEELLGHPSSTQSGLIVPHPGNPDLYYIFTVADGGRPDGLQYSIVDMTLDGGLGDVSSKNNPLANDVTEKLTAVTHANGSDIWLLSRSFPGNEFRSYLITATGISPVPIRTTIGINQPPDINNNGGGTRGQMKVSPDGQFLALAATSTRNTELFRFDTNSGLVSGAIELNGFFAALPGIPGRPYGVEFSSDSSKLYLTDEVTFAFNDTESTIYQFDLANYDQAAIIASGTALAPAQITTIGAIQLAIDGKIYITQFEENYLGAIDNPNVLGVGANYIENAVNLGTGESRLGLPPFIQSYFIVGLQARNFCLGEATEFMVNTSEPITSITWDFGDGGSSILEEPSHTYGAPGTYTISVTVTTATETKTESKDIAIYETPVANTPTDVEVCQTDPEYTLSLSTVNTEVLGGQLASENTITYYPNQADADTGTNILPDSYTNTAANETIYVRISNTENPSCYGTTSFDLIVKMAPELHTATDWVVCDTDADGFYDFDLSEKNTEILNGQSTATFSISYHETQADADTNTDAVGPTYTNTAAAETLFYRIGNNTYPECFETGSLALEVITGVTANAPTPFELCDDNNDGLFTVDLSLKNLEILDGQNPASFTVSHHTSLATAENGTAPLNSTSYTNTVPYAETIYVRVENNSNSSCYATTSLTLRVSDSPLPQTVGDWRVCEDDGDGTQTFDLSLKNIEILGNQPASDFTIGYYETESDAIARINAVAGGYQNTTNPQTIYYRIERDDNPACFLTDSFDLEVFNTPTTNAPVPIVVCDVSETGVQDFDLSGKDIEVLSGQDAMTYSVTYFGNSNDAAANENPLPKTNYRNTELQETIYARIQNRGLESCYDVTDFSIIVNPLPDPPLQETYVICPDSPELTVDGGDFESWSWRVEGGNELSTERNILISTLGTYSLTVSQTANGLSCEKTEIFEVVSSGAPEDFTATVSGFSDALHVEIDATGIGIFQYSVDGENFQDSNRFTVFPGAYTVYVRDRFLCRTLQKDIFALGYQKFFTPNGDGSNEYWNIIGGEHYPSAQLLIYDRYGKLLSQIAPSSQGWDGNHNGRPLPATDYWFKYIFEDGNVFAGHFALKR